MAVFGNKMLPFGGVTAVDNRFIITVKTDNAGTSGTNQFTIPTNNVSYTYDYDIETSDGQVILGNTGNTTITFPSAGTYDIYISRIFPSIVFSNGGDKSKLIDIKQWGNILWESFQLSFRGCNNLTTVTATDAPNLTNCSTFFRCFANCSNLVTMDVSSWDMSTITTCRDMFLICTNLTYLDVSNWNLSNLTDTLSMFSTCRILSVLDVTNWDVSNVTNMRGMFQQANLFNYSLANWDITSVIDFTSFMVFANPGLSTSNYDATLIGWEATLQAAFPSGVGYTPTISINFGAAKYTLGGSAETARQSLIDNFGWTIADGGGI